MPLFLYNPGGSIPVQRVDAPSSRSAAVAEAPGAQELHGCVPAVP
jgi:hypothetical protein